MSKTRPAPDRAGPSRPVTGSPARRRRRGLTLLVVVGLVAAGGYFGGRFLLDSVVNPQCTISAGGMTETFDPEQTGNAALIAALSLKRDLPPRAATIALTTAIQESKIRNLRYGDRDSLGLFQQRPSQGWGTEEEILDPVYSTNTFFDALVKYKGYENTDITTIAQKVQKSGFPEAYRDHEGEGRVLASTLTGHSPAGLTCRLDAPTASVAPADVAADLERQMGITDTSVGDGVLTVTAADATSAWAVAHWAVARAEQYGATTVTVGDRTWDRADRDATWSDGANDGTTVTIALA
ncbi:hypothetical protein [Humibacillus xanthopallidus]|uniref:hypothetical protein n=1 Tax=Humibacillus xanthopallidus TaxID=412689 RepID=UPI00384B5515